MPCRPPTQQHLVMHNDLGVIKSVQNMAAKNVEKKFYELSIASCKWN